jgi:hypothetical protein
VVPSLFILASTAFFASKYKNIITLIFIFYVLHALWIDNLILTDIEKVPLPRTERSGYLEDWTAGYGIKEVSEIVRDEYQRKPEEKIVVGTEGYFGPLPDGLQAYLNDISEITIIGVGVDISELPSQLVESKKFGNKTYLVINSSRLKTNPKNLGLELNAIYPKAFRPDGFRDTLLFFQVTDKALSF